MAFAGTPDRFSLVEPGKQLVHIKGDMCNRPAARRTIYPPLVIAMHIPVVTSFLAARTAAQISGNVTQASIFLPFDQPTNAEKLDPQLVGFSIELDRWPDWAGRQVGQPNQFVHSVMRQLTDRSGAPPYFRIGGGLPARRPFGTVISDPQAPLKINRFLTLVFKSAMRLIPLPRRPIHPLLQHATVLDETSTF